MNLEKKKKELQAQLNQKIQNLEQIERIRNQLIQEINRLQGQISLLDELEKDVQEQLKDKDNKTGGESEKT